MIVLFSSFDSLVSSVLKTRYDDLYVEEGREGGEGGGREGREGEGKQWRRKKEQKALYNTKW